MNNWIGGVRVRGIGAGTRGGRLEEVLEGGRAVAGWRSGETALGLPVGGRSRRRSGAHLDAVARHAGADRKRRARGKVAAR